MPYNAATAAANKAADAANGMHEFMREFKEAMIEAFREASQGPLPDKVEIVTVGQTSDSKLDRLVFCPDCLGRDGPAWGTHMIYWLTADPTRPGQVKRVEIPHAHPQVKKTLSYDAISVKEGLDRGTHGKQCIQCGHKMGIAA